MKACAQFILQYFAGAIKIAKARAHLDAKKIRLLIK